MSLSRSDRRDFLKLTAAGTLGMLAGPGQGPFARRALAAPRPATRATADTLIVLWMAGACPIPKHSTRNGTHPSRPV